jgi:GNAT superfamily N-acetyltransferase
MSDEAIDRDLVLKPAGLREMRDGVKVFARAMGRDGAHVEAWLFTFSKRLAATGRAHFVVARHKHRTVGYGSLVAYEAMGWIGFMGTEPGLQGRGIGASMMRYLIRLSEQLGLASLKLDATNIGKKLYSKFGFREEHPARMCEIPGFCSRGAPRDGPGSSVRITDEIPAWCLSMDRRAFGDDRSAVIRAALGAGAKLLLIEKRAFGLLDGKKLGPIVAPEVRAALDIVRAGSGLGATVTYVPQHPELPPSFLAELSLPEDKGPITCCTRMCLGAPVKQDLSIVFADYSAATG